MLAFSGAAGRGRGFGQEVRGGARQVGRGWAFEFLDLSKPPKIGLLLETFSSGFRNETNPPFWEVRREVASHARGDVRRQIGGVWGWRWGLRWVGQWWF